ARVYSSAVVVMDSSLSQLTVDCLICIFSYLDEDDLLRASVVSKFWNEAADTPWLWRQMCLRRWSFCNLSRLPAGMQTWKNYYLRRSKLEEKMEMGRASADYTCKTLRGHTGAIVDMAYLVGNSSLSESWNSMSIVCSASTDGTVRAWNVQEGSQLWSTPVQEPLRKIIVDQPNGVVISADRRGTIKAWKGLTGEELAAFPASSTACRLINYSIKDQPFLTAGTAGGSLYTLASPTLSQVSHVVAFDTYKIDVLLASPDKQWIVAATQDNYDLSPKVFSCESLSCASGDETPVSEVLPVSGCLAACFFPSEAARVLILHSDGLRATTAVSIFDITSKKTKYKTVVIAELVGTFQLDVGRWHSDILLEGRGSGTILTATQNQLKVYNLQGAMLASFEDHMKPISAICADSFRVVTASHDLSLRVLTWKKEKDKNLSLESRYHLLGGSHMYSRGFTNVACDYASIVASVAAVNGKDVLKAYSFNA
uniref:Si:ch73-142c19.1 n=1 Tax=Lepisosteus oculatus TaxID=7918 RepID=W5N9K8_LEPOC